MGRVFFNFGVALLAATTAFAQDAAQILQRTAAGYRGWHSVVIDGKLTSRFVHEQRTHEVSWTVSLAQADASMLPRESPVPALPQLIRRVRRNVTAGGVAVSNVPESIIGPLPSDWSSFDRMDSSVESARVTGEEDLALDGETLRCSVVEVVYRPGSRARSVPGRPVRYWIDPSQGFVIRQEFAQRGPVEGEIREWSFTVDAIRTNQPAPKWAVESLSQLAGSERQEWVGRDAPDFSLSSLDGRTIQLSDLRGKVVILSFWASWCVPCREEMKVLEKLKSDEVEVWGVNNESTVIAKGWLEKYGRALATLMDPDRELYRAYEVDRIPVSVVIGRNGRIASYVEGVRGDSHFRGLVERLGGE